MCEKDVKHVLRYLVVKKGIDVNSADEVAFLREYVEILFRDFYFLGEKDTLIGRVR